jgi:dephospho-CoA kinase
MRIGITGQIGAGKSTAARILQRMGGYLIDADRIGREVVEQNADLRVKLAGAFGRDVLDNRGKLKRNITAQRAFKDEKSKQQLDRLVHPYLLKELRRQIKEAEREHQVVLIDATLIFEWQLERELDLTVVIYAPRTIRFSRLQKKGVDAVDARARQRCQLSLAEYRRRADVVIPNRGSEAQLAEKLGRLWAGRVAKAIDS